MDKANAQKQESGGRGLSGQRQTERQDLSFQRERKRAASAERMKQAEKTSEEAENSRTSQSGRTRLYGYIPENAQCLIHTEFTSKILINLGRAT